MADSRGTHPLILDLLWVIGSEPILVLPPLFPEVEWFNEEAKAFERQLGQIGLQGESIDRYVDARSDKRLGAHFEEFVGFWLSHHPRMTLIAQNIQIQSAKRTLGELDYLIRDGDEVVHLEVAVKFYLSVTAGDHEYWVGPALRDRLDLKVRKLRERQLPIVETEGCVRWLKEKGLPQPTVQRVMLKGGLFSRETSLSGSGAKNDGWSWGRLTDFRDTDDFLWEVLRKPNWFAGCRGEGGAMSWQGLVESVECEWENFRAPVMVVRRSKLEGNPEVSRHFVVPKDWYGRALEMVQNSP